MSQAAYDAVMGALGAGQPAAAIALAERALAEGASLPLFHQLRAIARLDDGRFEEAVADYEIALAASPRDPAILSGLGLALARLGRTGAAIALFDRALLVAGRVPTIHFDRAWALESVGRVGEAREGYRRALRLDPAMAAAYGNLAALAARAGDWVDARAQAEAALARDPGQPPALMALAQAEAAEGRPDEAEAHFMTLLAPGSRASPEDRALVQGHLGDLMDAAGRPDDAFAWYEARAADLRKRYGPAFTAAGTIQAMDIVGRLTRYFQSASPRDWGGAAPTAADTGAPATHVFLLSFPRSGTTMLGQALAGHPQVATLDEHETFADVLPHFYADDEGMARLAALTSDDAARYRDLYWKRVREAGVEPADTVFVDKLPMNTLALPLIAKLFPDAKVLFLRRDPRDVVLSAFRRQFAVNPTTYAFTTLEGAARLYDAVMSLAERLAAVLPLARREQSYERLVADFETEGRAICAFLGLDWDPAMAAFAGRAGKVATPSSVQLARGLSSEGVGSWRRYERHLAPVAPVLAPWIKRYSAPEA